MPPKASTASKAPASQASKAPAAASKAPAKVSFLSPPPLAIDDTTWISRADLFVGCQNLRC